MLKFFLAVLLLTLPAGGSLFAQDAADVCGAS